MKKTLLFSIIAIVIMALVGAFVFGLQIMTFGFDKSMREGTPVIFDMGNETHVLFCPSETSEPSHCATIPRDNPKLGELEWIKIIKRP